MPPLSDFIIRNATPDDLPYIVSLAKRETGTIGFIPMGDYREYLDRQGILLAILNGQPCGFLVWRVSYGAREELLAPRDGERRIKVIQTCIQFDARRRDYGMALVSRLLQISARRKAFFVSLWCADDLEANAFWKSAGFTFGGTRQGGEQRGRIHNLWIFNLPASRTLQRCA